MAMSYQGWKNGFLVCLGLFAGTAFCMKWLETEFVAQGRLFTIIGLEISYTREEIILVLQGLEEPARSLLRYQLLFDFAFMAGVYPGIAALCMMASMRTGKPLLQKMLRWLAVWQIVAWGCDVTENLYLLKWLRDPGSVGDTGLYHALVWTKWIIALAAVLISVTGFLLRRKTRS